MEKTYEERLKSLGLWTPEEPRNRQDIIEVFKMYRDYSSVALHELFEIDTNNKGTRGHSCELKKVRYTRDIVRHFFRIELLIGGMRWIRVRWMHLASMPTWSSGRASVFGRCAFAVLRSTCS